MRATPHKKTNNRLESYRKTSRKDILDIEVSGNLINFVKLLSNNNMNYREKALKRITNFDQRIDFFSSLRRLSHSTKSGNTCALKKIDKA